jgi:hypothetical protein
MTEKLSDLLDCAAALLSLTPNERPSEFDLLRWRDMAAALESELQKVTLHRDSYHFADMLERREQAHEAARDAELAELRGEVEGWKIASGLSRGGDPDGVRPSDLERYIAALRGVEEEAVRFVDRCEIGAFRSTKTRRAFEAALAEIRKQFRGGEEGTEERREESSDG